VPNNSLGRGVVFTAKKETFCYNIRGDSSLKQYSEENVPYHTPKNKTGVNLINTGGVAEFNRSTKAIFLLTDRNRNIHLSRACLISSFGPQMPFLQSRQFPDTACTGQAMYETGFHFFSLRSLKGLRRNPNLAIFGIKTNFKQAPSRINLRQSHQYCPRESHYFYLCIQFFRKT